MDRGIITLDKTLTILGGYSPDFSTRDILTHRSTIIPVSKADVNRDKGVIFVDQGEKKGKTVIDGFIFDHADTNNYHATEAKPAGVETGLLMIPPTKASDKPAPSANIALINGNSSGEFIVSNNVFNNACHYGIWLGHKTGTFTAKNNVFTANRMAAIEVRGTGGSSKPVKVEILNNTILFTWSRLRDMGDMGYAVRGMTAANYVVKGNILGLSVFSGLDLTRVDSNVKLKKDVALDGNIFFLNKQADITAPGSGKFMRLWLEEHFEDLEDLDLPGTNFTSLEGNVGAAAAESLKAVINKAYLEGFLSASYKSTTDYNPDSPANTFRRAMGMNQVEKVTSTVTMFANRYPLEDAIKLFGAAKGYGAQKPTAK
ncbi:MAG TPA: right-handed parallel beta-helix repeat-containing protein [Myxococcota bacterium]|nr:right-handed parallel beta-helix repeat-containing protein [Myxococcota bacterium]HPL24609.1 right-handed parallel beta-helix repeat-containing protein [Myxococcota bacterium]HRR74048.1 right-handed parallel beta-helix repeat-containing protein [Myxococcota bacterium]HRV17617.1 right-handed parallel beta-helix repeat-containing protein [Myxococcota bacterium]